MAAAPGPPPESSWVVDMSHELQAAADRIFAREDGWLKGLRFSFTLADPGLEGCPLVGCSTGFLALSGYEMHEIIGRNCRFLLDPVPQELVNPAVRRWAREFCALAGRGLAYRLPEGELEPWMPVGASSDDGIFCVQTNARKDGALFSNMFYLARVDLNQRPYVIGLQTALPSGLRGSHDELGKVLHEARRLLQANMVEVEGILASKFWYSGGLRRQEHGDRDEDDGYRESPTAAEKGGHLGSPSAVSPTVCSPAASQDPQEINTPEDSIMSGMASTRPPCAAPGELGVAPVAED